MNINGSVLKKRSFNQPKLGFEERFDEENWDSFNMCAWMMCEQSFWFTHNLKIWEYDQQLGFKLSVFEEYNMI